VIPEGPVELHTFITLLTVCIRSPDDDDDLVLKETRNGIDNR